MFDETMVTFLVNDKYELLIVCRAFIDIPLTPLEVRGKDKSKPSTLKFSLDKEKFNLLLQVISSCPGKECINKTSLSI